MKLSVTVTFLFCILLCFCSILDSDNRSIADIVVEETMEKRDYLVYIVFDQHSKGKLMLYDPLNDIHVPILSNWDIDGISISITNRLAFSSSRGGNSEIYIIDYPFVDITPVNITQDTSTEDHIFSWSPDGHYLAYESAQKEGKALLIWDGHVISRIHSYSVKVSEITWSPDGRLAFTEFYTFVSPYQGDPSEIFIWDGETTTSISQNPSGHDRFPAWSADGQLAFLSERKGEYDIYVWDGKSKFDSRPDMRTYTNVASDLTEYYSEPVWTNSGSLSFQATRPNDRYIQIYEWDGEIATNISNNPNNHNGGQSWRYDGYWSFVTYLSRQQLVFIRDDTNQTLLTSEGQYSPAWSQGGLLLFCASAPHLWALSMWNGTELVEVSQGHGFDAMWNNGAGVFCSFG